MHLSFTWHSVSVSQMEAIFNLQIKDYDKTKIVKVFILKLLSNVTVYSLIYDVIFSNFKFCSLLH